MSRQLDEAWPPADNTMNSALSNQDEGAVFMCQIFKNLQVQQKRLRLNCTEMVFISGILVTNP